MSWQATAYVAEINDGITRSEKLVLLCLANRHNPDTGRCDPTVQRLAAEALMSESTAHRTLDKLIKKGFIRRELRTGTTSQYWIVGMEGGVKMTPPVSVKGVSQLRHPGGVKTEDGGVIAVTPKPKLEPKDNRTPPPPASADELDEVTEAFASYGGLSSGTVKAIEWSVEDYGIEWVRLAVRKAAASHVEGNVPWSYIESMLERWKRQGGPDEPKKESNDGRISQIGNYARRSGRAAPSSADVAGAWAAELTRES